MTLFEPSVGLRKVSEHWFKSRDGDQAANELFARHYSRRHYTDGRSQHLFVGPGEKLVLITERCDALFVWRRFIDAIQPPQAGVSCSAFRNESEILSSILIIEAMEVGRPGTRFYTIVNQSKVRSVNPGCCFKKAGWKDVARTKAGLVILAV